MMKPKTIDIFIGPGLFVTLAIIFAVLLPPPLDSLAYIPILILGIYYFTTKEIEEGNI